MYIPPAISSVSAPRLPTITDAVAIKQINIAARQASEPRSMTNNQNVLIPVFSSVSPFFLFLLIWIGYNFPGLICCCCPERFGGKRGTVLRATLAEGLEIEQSRTRAFWERARLEGEVAPPVTWETRLAQASQRRREVELTEMFQAEADVLPSGSVTATFPSAPAAVYAGNVGNQAVARHIPDGEPQGDTDPPPAYEHAPAYTEQ